jgi:PIN domain nuclease of toxin-antitoxin system
VKALLDTHTFLWWTFDPGKLSAPAAAVCNNPAAALFLSPVSAWEIQIKRQAGKLSLPRPLADLIAEHQRLNGLQLLAVVLEHVLDLDNLPPVHKDPFDRLLISQARVEGLTLLSADAVVAQYPVSVVW